MHARLLQRLSTASTRIAPRVLRRHTTTATATSTASDLPPSGTDGWVWGFTLDGEGMGTQLEPWDPLAWRLVSEASLGGASADLLDRVFGEDDPIPDHARGGSWLHLDFGKQKAREFLEATEKLSSSREDRAAVRLATRRLTKVVEGDQPRFLVQRWGDNPSKPAAAIICSLRSLLCDGSGSSGITAVTLRLRLTRSMLLSARIDDYAGLSQHPELRLDLLNGAGARSPGALFASIIEIVVDRCTPAIQALDNELYSVRDNLQKIKMRDVRYHIVRPSELAELRRSLAPIRQQTIWLLRYLRPQREALQGLLRWSETEEELFGEQDLLEKPALARCREARFRLSALVSELEAHAESGEVLQDELVALASEQIAHSDNMIGKVGLALSLLVFVQLGLDVTQLAHQAGLIDLNAVFPKGRF